jgi:chromosome partitioning protein
MNRYNLPVLESAIFERADLANCAELVIENDEEPIPDPKSVLDYAPSSKSSQEFNQLADEIFKLI